MRSLPRAAQAYVSLVVAAATAVFVLGLVHAYPHWRLVVFLAALFWFADSRPVATQSRVLAVSAGFPVALASILLGGPWAAAIVCSVTLGIRGAPGTWFKRMFNGAQSILSVFFAGELYQLCPNSAGSSFAHASFPAVLAPVALAGLMFFVFNSGFIAVVIRLTTGTSFGALWWSGLSELALANLGYSSIGLIMAVLWSGGVGPAAALLVLVPLLVARWAFQQYGDEHRAYEATVASLIRAVETKDYYTRGHSERVSKAAVMIAQQLKMRPDRLEMLRYAGMLHDVGKLGVPTKVLQKTGPLDDAEYASIQQHPVRGFDIVKGIGFLDEAVLGVRYHHERMDGLGYPEGLAGDRIPEFARVIAVADAFDSMTSTRSYRGARPVMAALNELRRWAGSQFDPVVVEALRAAVAADGWDPHVDLTDQVVDPSLLVIADHDDPSVPQPGLVQPPAALDRIERVS
jgi:hypothetical protein